MKYFKITLTILIIFLISCEKEEGLKTNSTDIVPLKVGNKWSYTTYLYEEGKEVENGTTTTSVDKLVYLTINREVVKSFQVKNTSGDLYTNRFVGVTPNGYTEYGLIADFDNMIYSESSRRIIYIGNNDTITYNSLIAKYPVQANETWTTKNSYSNLDYDASKGAITVEIQVDTVDVECVETNKTINTGIGSYSCIGYRYGDNDNYTISYYSIGYGMIKSEFYENGEIEGYSILTGIDL